MGTGEVRCLLSKLKSYLLSGTPSNHELQNTTVPSKHSNLMRFDQNCWLLWELKARYGEHLDFLFGS